MSLDVSHLHYRRSGRFALSDISIQFTQPVTALIGPNGAGKSTLLQCLANQLPWQGELTFQGYLTRRADAQFFRKTVGYLPQKTLSDSSLSVFEVVLLGMVATLSFRVTAAQTLAVRHILTLLELEPIADRPMRELSGGQQQLVLLAQTLCKQPAIVLLDEPLNNLDIRKQFHFLDTVCSLAAAKNLLIITVLHDIQMAMKYAQRVVVLHQGRLHAYGPPAQVITPSLMREVFGVEACTSGGSHGPPILDITGASPATPAIGAAEP